MGKTNIYLLSELELKKVWNRNSKLRELCEAKYIGSKKDYLASLLYVLKPSLAQVNIDFHNHNEFIVRDDILFLEGLMEINDTYTFFESDSESQDLLAQAEECLHISTSDDFDCGMQELYLNKFDEIMAQLQERVLIIINQYTDLNQKVLFDYFYNIFRIHGISRNSYILDLDDPKLYEPQTVCYA